MGEHRFACSPLWGKPGCLPYLDGLPIPFIFKNTTFDVEAGHVTTWRNRHVFSLGGNFRYNGSPAVCSPGPYDDRDDLVFAVGAP